jgi:polyphosphate kinase 2
VGKKPKHPSELTLSAMEEHPPYVEKLDNRRYEDELRALQIELLKLQRHVNETGAKVVVIFEGRDAAGKGGSIRRFAQNMNPRSARTVALPKPNDTEKGQWYFQRYTQNLPTKGEIVFFDRSWYNRAGVEIVMGFCTPKEYGEFFRQVSDYERSLVESGISLFKHWYTVSRENQAKRFDSRREDPLRQWKLSPMDEEAQARWDDYSRARDAVLIHTDADYAPWTVINSNEKKRARLEAIRNVVHHLDYEHKDHSVATAPDPMVLRRAVDVVDAAVAPPRPG